MPLPLAIAAPAAAASLAYFSAKASLPYDYRIFKTYAAAAFCLRSRSRNGTMNHFYELEERARSPSTAQRNLIIFEGRRLTYAQVYDSVLRYGAWLRADMGVQAGDIVAMDFQNSDTFIIMWYALWSIGAKPAFINWNMTGKSLTHCLNAATTKLCLVDPALAANFDDDHVRTATAEAGIRCVVFTPELQSKALSAPAIRAPDKDLFCDDPAGMAMLIYTSGTTGLPKAAHVPWRRIVTAAMVGTIMIDRNQDSVMYTAMPLYHSAASVIAFCPTIRGGAALALGRKFSTRTFWQEVRDADATAIQYVGETLRYLLAAPPQLDPVTGANLDKQHKVRLAFGNGLRPDIWNRFKDRFGIDTIAEIYAATEGALATLNVSSNDLSAGAVGRSGWLTRSLLGGKIALVRVDWETDRPWRDPKTGFCRAVEPGQPGEMMTLLPPNDVGTYTGYHANKEATDSKLLRDVFTKGDVYYRTGDMLIRGPDGLTYFSDRIGDTFRWKSENVSTTEVSEAVGTHPAVREANVYGVELPHHDGRAGCVAISFDTPDPDAATLRSLASHVKAALPRYAQPLFLRLNREVGGESQITGTMKQLKNDLRKAGVKPDPDTKLYWLKGDDYVPFGKAEWDRIVGGQVRL